MFMEFPQKAQSVTETNVARAFLFPS